MINNKEVNEIAWRTKKGQEKKHGTMGKEAFKEGDNEEKATWNLEKKLFEK